MATPECDDELRRLSASSWASLESGRRSSSGGERIGGFEAALVGAQMRTGRPPSKQDVELRSACSPRLCQEAEVEDGRAPGELGCLLRKMGQVGRR